MISIILLLRSAHITGNKTGSWSNILVETCMHARTHTHTLTQTPSTGLQHPSITAVFSYAIRSRKLSANKQFFVVGETVVSLLQTTQIISYVCFITDHVAYSRSDKTQIVSVQTELFFFFFLLFLPGVDASHVCVHALALGCFYSHISTRSFRRALTASLDSCAEIRRRAPSVT